MPYTHIVCCGLGTYAGVQNANYRMVTGRTNYYLSTGNYVGDANVDQDIATRIDYVKTAIEQIRTILGPNNPNHLKVFMTPEFLFRGPNGAYSVDKRDEVLKRLYNLASAPYYTDWLFVFGSILSWSAPTRRAGVFNRQRVLDQYAAKEVYNTVLLTPGGWRNYRPLRDSAWQQLAGTKLKNDYNERDFNAEMGATVGWIVSKRLRSSVDFVWFDNFINGREAANLAAVDVDSYRDIMFDKGVADTWDLAMSDWEIWREIRGFAQTRTVNQQKQAHDDKIRRQHNLLTSRARNKIRDRTPSWNVNRTYHRYAGTGVLQHEGIDIAVEICLDHIASRLSTGHKRRNGKVHLHLVPSAGASIQDNAIVAKTNGLIFNNDGARPEMTDGDYNTRWMAAALDQRRSIRRQRRRCILERQQPGPNIGIEPAQQAPIVFPNHANILAQGPGNVYVFPAQPVP